MSFKRQNVPTAFASSGLLTSQLVKIGFLFAADPAPEEPNIENTLIAASLEGLNGDYRALSLLVDWISIHVGQLNVDRLVKILKELKNPKLRAFWSSIAQWQKSDPRLRKLSRIYRGERVGLLDAEIAAFHLKRDGEDPRFVKTHIIVPNKLLRHRPNDVMDPAAVARIHLGYRYRLMIGPTYRADMWAALEKNPKLTASELARFCYGSFSTAWNVKRDWEIVRRAVG